MAKIKSTLDLIMEKTGHLSLNAEEKEEMKREERVRRIRGIVAPFLNGEKDVNLLMRELDRLPPEDREENRGFCLEQLRDALDPLAGNERALLGLEKIAGTEERVLWEERLSRAKGLSKKRGSSGWPGLPPAFVNLLPRRRA